MEVLARRSTFAVPLDDSLKGRGLIYFKLKHGTGQFFQFKQATIGFRLKNNVML